MSTVGMESGRLRLRLSVPGTSYRGTRFDWAGVFESVQWGGTEMAGRWFERYDPTMHDAVCGPSEEFTQIGYGQGGTFLKIGVGRLRGDDAPYDRFKLYPVVDGGQRSLVSSGPSAVFRHEMPEYSYEKEIVLMSGDSFSIRHRLESSVLLEGEVYNHNFFTFGRFMVDQGRTLDFPFVPTGHWRAAYDSVSLSGRGVRFSRALGAGESVFMGDLAACAGATPYDLTLRDNSAGVRILGDRPLTHTVFWANHRVACPEPYVAFRAAPGEPFEWRIDYFFFQ